MKNAFFTGCYEIIKNFVAKFVDNASIQQIFKLSLQEQMAFVDYLHELNTRTLKLPPPTRHISGEHGFFQVINRHFQLPCSPETRRRRADWFDKNASRNSVIYLLGDDDLVAVELCQRGFKNVYVADCDEKVLDTIKNQTSHMPTRPRVIQADFTDETFAANPPADYVCIDPPYNKSWALVFVKTALRCVSHHKHSRLLLMINPYSLGREFTDLLTHMHQQSWSLRSHLRHFNTYQIRGLNKFYLWLTWTILKLDCRHPARDMYFGSDLFVFGPANDSLEKDWCPFDAAMQIRRRQNRRHLRRLSKNYR